MVLLKRFFTYFVIFLNINFLLNCLCMSDCCPPTGCHCGRLFNGVIYVICRREGEKVLSGSPAWISLSLSLSLTRVFFFFFFSQSIHLVFKTSLLFPSFSFFLHTRLFKYKKPIKQQPCLN